MKEDNELEKAKAWWNKLREPARKLLFDVFIDRPYLKFSPTMEDILLIYNSETHPKEVVKMEKEKDFVLKVNHNFNPDGSIKSSNSEWVEKEKPTPKEQPLWDEVMTYTPTPKQEREEEAREAGKKYVEGLSEIIKEGRMMSFLNAYIEGTNWQKQKSESIINDDSSVYSEIIETLDTLYCEAPIDFLGTGCNGEAAEAEEKIWRNSFEASIELLKEFSPIIKSNKSLNSQLQQSKKESESSINELINDISDVLERCDKYRTHDDSFDYTKPNGLNFAINELYEFLSKHNK